MKKVLLIITALLLTAAMLTGCFAGTKEYTCQDMTMTVPSNMKDVSDQSDFSSFTFALDSTKIAIFGIKEKFSGFEDGENTTLEEYADIVLSANNLDTYAIERSGGAYMYFRFESDTDDGTYKYLAGVYKGTDAFWLIQIAALTTNYDETAFFEYLDSVSFA